MTHPYALAQAHLQLSGSNITKILIQTQLSFQLAHFLPMTYVLYIQGQLYLSLQMEAVQV